ncbi:MAG: carboxylesterase family protein [Magnetospirillum sp. WYHS-4]
MRNHSLAGAVIALTLAIQAAGTGTAAAQQGCAAGSTIDTDKGQVCGGAQAVTLPTKTGIDLFVYKGIPYARPPTGANGLRWKAPEPPDSWAATGVFPALQFGSVCPQPESKGAPISAQDENCLFLNVWTPAQAIGKGALPVMVFIHGGAFIGGSGSLPIYDGAYLAASGNQVVVTLNYRLGALGFLYADRSPDAKIEPVAGNFGLLDQQAALRWVRDNAKGFGGDPAKVTIFGESAGAMSVGLHLFDMPDSAPLFRAAIMESNPMSVQYRDKTEGSADGKSYLKLLCANASPKPKRCVSDAAWLQTPTWQQAMAAQSAYSSVKLSIERILKSGFAEALPWTPLMDGKTVAGQPYDGYAAGMPAKPYLFGTNADEGVLFAALVPEKDLNPTTYGSALDALFGRKNKGTITDFTNSAGTRPYRARDQKPTPYYNGSAVALANVITDFAFRCGSQDSADATLSQADKPVYGYYFSEAPIYNPFPASPACSVASGNVCHGAELPYVFNTLNVVADPVPPANAQLAQAMAAAWSGFAANLSVPAAWTAYTKNGGLYVWNSGASGGQMLPGMATTANCQQLWYGIPPLGGTKQD